MPPNVLGAPLPLLRWGSPCQNGACLLGATCGECSQLQGMAKGVSSDEFQSARLLGKTPWRQPLQGSGVDTWEEGHGRALDSSRHGLVAGEQLELEAKRPHTGGPGLAYLCHPVKGNHPHPTQVSICSHQIISECSGQTPNCF